MATWRTVTAQLPDKSCKVRGRPWKLRLWGGATGISPRKQSRTEDEGVRRDHGTFQKIPFSGKVPDGLFTKENLWVGPGSWVSRWDLGKAEIACAKGQGHAAEQAQPHGPSWGWPKDQDHIGRQRWQRISLGKIHPAWGDQFFLGSWEIRYGSMRKSRMGQIASRGSLFFRENR